MNKTQSATLTINGETVIVMPFDHDVQIDALKGGLLFSLAGETFLAGVHDKSDQRDGSLLKVAVMEYTKMHNASFNP